MANDSRVPHKFDPEVHLIAASLDDGAEIKKITMADLGFPSTALSGIAATYPFPLFTVDAIRLLREEAVGRDIMAKHMYSDNGNPCVIRGHGEDPNSFTYQAWTHPEVQRRVNHFAGIELERIFDYEIGHTNIQLGPRGWAGLKAEPDLPSSKGDLASVQEIQPTLYEEPNWHFDSYPFVCVLMLSDSIHLKGGQTVLRKADETNMFVPLPPIGHAVILHGGYVCHAVSPTEEAQERMSMVTSYRPANPAKEDSSVLRTVRTQSDVPTLHREWSMYRLRVLAARAAMLADQLERDKPEVEGVVENALERFVREQTAYLSHTLSEMVDPVERVRTDTRKTFLEWMARQDSAPVSS